MEGVVRVSLWLGRPGILVVIAALGLGCSDGSPSAGGSGGDPWSAINPTTRLDAYFAIGPAGADLYLGGSGDILRSSDSGKTWSVVATGALSAGYGYHAIAATAEDDVWLAGTPELGPAQWLHSADRGNSWQSVDVGSISPSFGMWSIDRAHVLVTTTDGEIRKTADGGATWTQVFHESALTLFAVWGAAASADLYAVGGHTTSDATASGPGLILHSTDGGDTWQHVLDGLACTLFSVSGTADGATVTAAGDCATVATTTDHGATWASSGFPSPLGDFSINGVWVSPTGTNHLLVSGDKFYGASFASWDVCLSVHVDAQLIGRMGCEALPPYMGGTSTPLAIWGTGDEDIWVTGAYVWHRH